MGKLKDNLPLIAVGGLYLLAGIAAFGGKRKSTFAQNDDDDDYTSGMLDALSGMPSRSSDSLYQAGYANHKWND